MIQEPKEEDNRHYPSPMAKETNKLLDPNKKPAQKYSKGVAMSFGFKRRPTPMTSNASLVAWEAGSRSGNKPNEHNHIEQLNQLLFQMQMATKTETRTNRRLPKNNPTVLLRDPRGSVFHKPTRNGQIRSPTLNHPIEPLRVRNRNVARTERLHVTLP